MMVLPARHPRPYILDHTLAINEVLIKARLLEQTTPNVELLEWQHDRNLRRWRPILSVVPDGFLHFVVTSSGGRHSYPILLDVDLGTIDRRRWQEKVRRYLQFFTGEFQTVFHTDAATVAIVVSLSAQDLFLSPRFQVAFKKDTEALLQIEHTRVVA
jgi:Replication-relaxation